MAKASTVLRVEMARRGWSIADLGRTVGVAYWRLYKITRGTAEPTFDEAVEIEEGVGIAVEAWPSLRRAVAKLLKLRAL